MSSTSLVTTGTPNEKPWLHLTSDSLDTNTVTANTVNVGTIATSIPLYLGNVMTTSTAGPFVLTAAQVVGGVLANTYNPGGAVTVTYTLPTAAALLAFTETKEPAFYFKFNISNSKSTVTLSFTLGAGCTYVAGGTSFSLVGAGEANLIFSFVNGVCTVYG